MLLAETPEQQSLNLNDPLTFIGLVRKGLSKKVTDVVAEKFAITDREMAHILKISERTFHRYKADTQLDEVATERLLQLLKLYEYGEEVFEDLGRFKAWMRRPLGVLGNNAPFSLLDTAKGFELVNDTLMRIDYGVYA